MPIIWRYVLSQYLKIFTLTVLAFIAILLTVRMEEIAYFISLAPHPALVIKFIAYQVPYILPLALPLAALLAAWLTMRHLSDSNEIVALRSCGCSLYNIAMPLLLASATISLGNFYGVSEVATAAHRAADELKSEFKALNPLMLLQSKHLLRLRGANFVALGPTHVGESLEDCIIALPGPVEEGISCMVAKKLALHGQGVLGSGVTLFTEMPIGSNENLFFIENSQQFSMPLYDAGLLLQNKNKTVGDDSMALAALYSRWKQLEVAAASADVNDSAAQRLVQRSLVHCVAELARRLYSAFAVFSFTLLGIACGITVGRQACWQPLALAVACALVYLAALFVAKGVTHSLVVVVALYCVPHFLIISISMWRIHKVEG